MQVQAVILAGGLGTRISEETHLKPKPMVEIGSRPILWHIMKIFSHFGIFNFVICLGYKGYVIKEYFANYALHMSDVTFDMKSGQTVVHRDGAEPWNVTLVDTGETTATGGRVKRAGELLNSDESFFLTYGDGLANVDLRALQKVHSEGENMVTLTAVQPPGRYGALELTGDSVSGFTEKPSGDGAWINGGFFVVDPTVLNSIGGDETSWEQDVLPRLAQKNQLGAFRHQGFWQAMDTLRDKHFLEHQWASEEAAWRVWA